MVVVEEGSSSSVSEMGEGMLGMVGGAAQAEEVDVVVAFGLRIGR